MWLGLNTHMCSTESPLKPRILLQENFYRNVSTIYTALKVRCPLKCELSNFWRFKVGSEVCTDTWLEVITKYDVFKHINHDPSTQTTQNQVWLDPSLPEPTLLTLAVRYCRRQCGQLVFSAGKDRCLWSSMGTPFPPAHTLRRRCRRGCKMGNRTGVKQNMMSSLLALKQVAILKLPGDISIKSNWLWL